MATATTRKSTTPAKKTAAKGGRFPAESLPKTGTGQYRQGGDYKPSLSAIGTFAKGDDKNRAHFKALVHLGWVKKGGVNAKSESPAFKTANEAGLPAECWTVDAEAAPQISANLLALAEAGAPEEALNDLWAAYVGTGEAADVL